MKVGDIWSMEKYNELRKFRDEDEEESYEELYDLLCPLFWDVSKDENQITCRNKDMEVVLTISNNSCGWEPYYVKTENSKFMCFHLDVRVIENPDGRILKIVGFSDNYRAPFKSLIISAINLLKLEEEC